jgi:carboxymethylenebutenolidase
MGEIVKVGSENSRISGYLSMPRTSQGPGVLVLHAWWGLNEFFKRFCDRLAGKGFIVFAPDLYEGKVARTREEAKELMTKQDSKQLETSVMASSDYLASHPAVKGRRVGVVGFSMGANWALWLSSKNPDLSAVVVFYGTGEEADFSKSRASFLGHFAEEDEFEPKDYVLKLEKLIRSAGKEVQFYFYPKVGHWFFEEDRPEFNDKAASLAWERTVQFLDSKLK